MHLRATNVFLNRSQASSSPPRQLSVWRFVSWRLFRRPRVGRIPRFHPSIHPSQLRLRAFIIASTDANGASL